MMPLQRTATSPLTVPPLVMTKGAPDQQAAHIGRIYDLTEHAYQEKRYRPPSPERWLPTHIE